MKKNVIIGLFALVLSLLVITNCLAEQEGVSKKITIKMETLFPIKSFDEEKYGEKIKKELSVSLTCLKSAQKSKKKEDYKKAIEKLEGLREYISFSSLSYLIGTTYLEVDEREKALESFKQAINEAEKGETDGHEYYILSSVIAGAILYGEGMNEEAFAYFKNTAVTLEEWLKM